MKRIFQAEETEKQMGFAAAVHDDGLLWVSGMVSWDETLTPLHPGDMRQQMAEVYQRLQGFLAGFNAGLDAIIRETVFVTDIDTALANSDVRNALFDPERLPAATWIEVRRLVHPDLLIEVECVARVTAPTGNS
jgi:enamine deaminase RidA (YjgF/YER057c/UK114 family)